jgi:hypothetical protein
MDSRRQNDPWWKKLGWLILIWAASVTALGVVAWLMRLLMRAAGLTSG